MPVEKLSVEWWDDRWGAGQTSWKTTEDAAWPFDANLKAVGYAGEASGAGLRAFVPLCGDSAVVPVLLQRGFEVTGVEGSPKACAAMRKRLASIAGDKAAALSEKLTLVCGDFFHEARQLPAASFDLIYDRASFVAVSPDRRREYAEIMTRLRKPSTRMYFEGVWRNKKFAGSDDPAAHVQLGPPHHTEPDHVRALYEPMGWQFDLILGIDQ
eukprot:gene13951-21337_t